MFLPTRVWIFSSELDQVNPGSTGSEKGLGMTLVRQVRSTQKGPGQTLVQQVRSSEFGEKNK